MVPEGVAADDSARPTMHCPPTSFPRHNDMKTILQLIILMLLASCSSQEEGKKSPIDEENNQYVACTNITVIDGKGTALQKNMVVLFKDSLIYDVAKLSNYPFPGNTKKYDATGQFIIPGLIDMHAHVTVLPFDKETGYGDHYDLQASLASLQSFLAYGVTTVRNVAAATIDGIELRDRVNGGDCKSPRVFTSGYALNKRNFGPFKSTKTVQQVQQAVKEQVEAGVDMIKVYAALEPKLVKAAIAEAHKLGVPVVGHLQNTTWTEAAKLGIDFITHAAPWNGKYLSEQNRQNYIPTMLGRLHWIEKVDLAGKEIQDMLQAMLENNVSVDPTLIAFHTKFWANDSFYTRNPNLKIAHPIVLDMWQTTSWVGDWTASDFAKAQGLWSKLTELTRLMYEKGILLTTGSDFPNPWILPGIGIHQEMQLLVEAGIPELEVIKMATFNAAKALKIDGTHGSIEKGKIADAIILNANPGEEISNTMQIATILKNGEFFTTDELLIQPKKNPAKNNGL